MDGEANRGLSARPEKVVIVYSGGMDSTVLLHALVRDAVEVKALSIDYGQRHKKELDAAKYQTARLGVEHKVADLSALRSLLSSSALTSETLDVPSGHYTAESMKVTIVPNRNMIMLAVAAGWAMSLKYDAIAYAAHAGDHAIYPDCRPEFAESVAETIRLADWHEVRLLRPFVRMTKGEICRLGAKLGVEYDKTWSCYRGGAVHCGTCGTCVERREAFETAAVPDRTVYEEVMNSVVGA